MGGYGWTMDTLRLLIVITVTVVTFSSAARAPDSIPGKPPFELDDDKHCRARTNATCYSIENTTCFGAKLNYTSSSSEFIFLGLTLHHVQNELSRWEGLRTSPKCWEKIQPLLCAVYMPKCQDEIVEFPAQELCKVARSSCNIVELAMKEWPAYLKCEKFPLRCKNTEIRELRFNASKVCMDPLIPVENSTYYYDGFDGCGLKCNDPLYTDEQHEVISKVIYGAGIVCLVATGWVPLTYCMGWKAAKSHTRQIFYVAICYFLATAGWMIQFVPNAKNDIVCSKESTVRLLTNSSSGENVIFCGVVFVLIYCGSMAALCWQIVFAYVWNLACSTTGKTRVADIIEKQSVYYHTFAWGVPPFLTFLCVMFGRVEGNSITGICFVGNDPIVRIFFVVLPVSVGLLALLFLLLNGSYNLRGHNINTHSTRVSFVSVLAIIILISFFCIEIHLMLNRPVWQKNLREFHICNMNLTDIACEVPENPGITWIVVEILTFFAGGVLVLSWAVSETSGKTWRRSLFKFFCCRSSNQPSDHPRSMPPKHKLIQKAYSRRHQIQANGRLSLSFGSTHDGGDPVEMNRMLDPDRFGERMGRDHDLESNTQLNQTNTEGEYREEISSEFAAAIPHLLTRRGGIIPPSSNSVSCVSEDNSRRPSCDSAISEFGIQQLRNSNSDLDRHDTKRGRRWFLNKLRRNRRGGGRGSSSSVESTGSRLLPALTKLIDKKLGPARARGGMEAFEFQMRNNRRIETTTVREFAIQTSCTSIEKLSYLQPSMINNLLNTTNLTMCDKSTQSSLHNLTEIGTQTKKSSLSKKEKSHHRSRKHDKETKDAQTNGTQNDIPEEDPVLKLLTPGK